MLAELLRCISSLREILTRKFLQTDFAVDGHENVSHQSDESLVRTDIGGRLLAANVLFASRKRKHEPALSVAIGSLADEASRHLADVSFPRGDDAAIRTAESKRDAE